MLGRKIWDKYKLYGTKSKDTIPTQVVKQSIGYASGTVDGIKMELSGLEGDVKKTKAAERTLLLKLLQLLLLHKQRVLRWRF